MRRGEGEGIPCLSQPLGSLGGKENPAGRLAPGCHHRGPPLASPVDRVPGTHAHERAAEEGPEEEEEEEAWGGGRGQLGSVGCWAARQK